MGELCDLCMISKGMYLTDSPPLGVFLYSPIVHHVTIMFPSGAGVEARARGTILSITILLPETFMNQTEGLFGVMNNDPNDDFTFRNGSTLPTDTSQEMLYELGASCK